jgi:hypothetical protein
VNNELGDVRDETWVDAQIPKQADSQIAKWQDVPADTDSRLKTQDSQLIGEMQEEEDEF